MELAFANLATPDGDRAAVQLSSGTYRLDRLFPGCYEFGLRAMLDDWAGHYAGLPGRIANRLGAGGAQAARVPNAEVRLTTPVKYPNKLVCVGAVYRDHLQEMGLPAERWPHMPIFLRPPTTSLVGPQDEVRMPPDTQQFDWEIELAVVLGARLTDGDLDQARAAIAGYSVGIDLTCRDQAHRSPVGVDLMRAKAQDGMAPMGPVLVPAEFVGDPQRLRLRLSVNGETKQDGSTGDMLYSVYEQVATISRFITLEPGDVVFTGSCAGGGAATGRFLQPGDSIHAEIEDVGCLDLRVAAPRQRPAGFRAALHP